MSKIVITGGNGFLGKHLVDKLQSEYDIHDFDVIRSKQYDLSEQNQVRQMYKDLKPEVVLHMAAVVGGIGANQSNPGLYFYKNMAMGLHMMEEARVSGVKKFVAVGTICAYPKFAAVPFKEEDLWDGYPEETNAPYGLAKKMMLVQSQAYRQQYGFNSIYLLPVNLYGPYDNFDLESSHVIPAMIRKIIEAKNANIDTVTLWGDGSASREFLYAGDAADAILKATFNYNNSDPLNIGTGREISIKDLANIIKVKCGFKGNIVWDSNRPNGQPRRCLDVSKINKLLGWKASMQLEDGIDITIKWYETNKSQ